MGRLLVIASSLSVLGWLAVAVANAATLEAIQGEVLVNRGNGYRFVSGSIELKPGDTVIANTGGAAQLSYGGGCSVPVQAGSVVTVGGQSPCVTQTNTGQTGIAPGTLAIGAVVVGGGIAAAVLLSSGDDKPASP